MVFHYFITLAMISCFTLSKEYKIDCKERRTSSGFIINHHLKYSNPNPYYYDRIIIAKGMCERDCYIIKRIIPVITPCKTP